MKNLIIVCDEKHRYVGDYLSQLVSLEDDEKDKIVGVKDGEVVVQVWTEKHYESNAPQISSKQYILFIGNTKLVKEKSLNMNIYFNKFGMKYGWLGTSGFLTVDRKLSLKEFNDFIEFATEIRGKEKLIRFFENVTSNSKKAGVDLAAGLFVPLMGMFGMKKSIDSLKQIETEQYNCCAEKFYLDDMSKFIGLK